MIGETSITVFRPGVGAYTNGVYVPGEDTAIVIRGVIQPMSAREVMMLPEGIRTKARWKLYTRFLLQESSVLGQLNADRVVHDSVATVVHANRDFTGTAPVIGLTEATKSLNYRRYVLVEPEVV